MKQRPASVSVGSAKSVGESQLAELLQLRDWSLTPVGPPATWSPSLRTILRILFSSRCAMWMGWGAELTFFCNEGCRSLLGSKPERALGAPAPQVWAEFWPQLAPRIDLVLNQGQAAADLSLQLRERSGGQLSFQRLSFSPVPDDSGAVRGVLCVITDETERIHEIQLLQSQIRALKDTQQRRMADLFNDVPAAIVILHGPQHICELANPAFHEFAMHRPLIGKPLLEAMPELHDQGTLERLDEVYSTGKPLVGRACRLLAFKQEGQPLVEVFFDYAYQPMFDSTGQVEGVSLVAFEVTELVRKRKEAEVASRVKDEFLAMLGHELRNPLAPIMTALQIMRLRGHTDDGKERATIERQVQHLVGLVDDLLDISRITGGKLQLKLQRVELAQVVARAIEQASPLLEQRRHQLIVELPSQGLPVNADPSRLAQVFANLLTNAAKYTEPGGRITMRASREAGSVVLTVKDTGIGIAPELLPRVFDLFAQSPQAPDRSLGGIGLGLSIVRSLTQLHGGSVTVRSEGRGHGAEFTVVLPLAVPEAREERVAAAPPPVAATPSKRAGRVLVVDDNQDAAELLSELLADCGYVTRWAIDGPSALTLAESFLPDVAILDIGLPVMDGYELAQRFAQHPKLRRARLIAVTGYGQEQDRQRTAQAGFLHHLVKPVELEQLRSTVESVLGPEVGKVGKVGKVSP